MSYSIHADLLAEQQKTAYEPSLSLTVQDNGLLHPVSLSTSADTGDGTMIYTGSVFVRAYARNGVGIYIQRITNPATASQWTSWTLLISGSQYVNPVLLSVPGYVVLVYADASTSPNTVIYWRRSADGGQTWSAAQTLLTSAYTLEAAFCGISCTSLYGSNYGAIYYKGNSAGTLLARKFYDPGTDTWGATYTVSISSLGVLTDLSGVLLEGASASAQLALRLTDSDTGLESRIYLLQLGHNAAAPHLMTIAATRFLRSLPAVSTAYFEGLAFTRRSNSEAWLSLHLRRNSAVSNVTRVTITAKAENEFSQQLDGGLFLEPGYGRLFVFVWEATGRRYAADLQNVWESAPVAALSAAFGTQSAGRIISYSLEADEADLSLEVMLDNRDGTLSGLLAGYLGADIVFERGAVCGATARRVTVGRMVVDEVRSHYDGERLQLRAYGYWRLLDLWRGDVGYVFTDQELWSLIELLAGLAGVRGFDYNGWDYASDQGGEDPFIFVIDRFRLGSGQAVASALRSLQDQYQFTLRPAVDGGRGFVGYATAYLGSLGSEYTFSEANHPTFRDSYQNQTMPDNNYFIVSGEGLVAEGGSAVRYESGRQHTKLISRRYSTELSELTAVANSAVDKAEEAVTGGRFECLPAFQLQPLDRITFGGESRLVGRIRETLDETGWRQRIDLIDHRFSASDAPLNPELTLNRAEGVMVRGAVVSFDSVTWEAVIILDGGSAGVSIPCGQWLPASLLTEGSSVAVLLFDESNPGDGLVVGPYGGASPVMDGVIGSSQEQIIYVGKHGNDTNSGASIGLAKLTIAAAITVASGLTPSASNRIVVQIMDAGIYVENVTMVAHVDVIGPSATLDGTITVIDNSTIRLREINPSSGSGLQLIKKTSGTSSSYVYIDRIDSRNVTSSQCVRNQANGSVVFIWCVQMWVGAGNTGVGDQTNGFGHVHVMCPDLYLAGNNALGIAGNSNNSSIIGYIDHILETGTPTGTVAISVGASGVVHLTCTQIIADTAYTITAGGELNLVCPDVNGAQTGTITTEISDQLIKSRQLQSTVAVGTAPLVVTSTTGVTNLRLADLDAAKVSALWESDGGAAAWQTNAAGDLLGQTGVDVRPNSDAYGLWTRLVNRGFAPLEHWAQGADQLTWTGFAGYTGFSNPPNTVAYTNSRIGISHTSGATRYFYYRTGFTSLTNKQIFAFCVPRVNAQAGIMIDDGVNNADGNGANNFFRLFLDWTGGGTSYAVLTIERRTGGGAVTTTTLQNLMPSTLYGLGISASGTIWTNWTANAFFFNDAPISTVGSASGQTWTPARMGVYGRQTAGGSALQGLWDWWTEI